MKAPFSPPYATMKEKIEQMHLHSKSIDDENESRSEMQQCSPIVDNKVLLAALDQRTALLEALEECRSDVWYQIEAKHGAEKARNYPSIVKADAAIAAARGTV